MKSTVFVWFPFDTGPYALAFKIFKATLVCIKYHYFTILNKMNVESSNKKICLTFVMPPPGFGKQCACANFYFDDVLQVLSSYQNSMLFYCSG